MAFGCGQCHPCRVNKRREWTNRVMLEAKLHPVNCMATLTYADEHLTLDSRGRGVLVPQDLQGFLKRLRAHVAPVKFRFYGCGEYGDVSKRPHYHLALFNYPNCAHGQSRYNSVTRQVNCCGACDTIRDKWGKGGVFLCELNDNTAQYVAQYVTKKMTSADDYRLDGLPPEFARMSLRPGIGHDAMWEVASSLLEFDLVDSQGDVPSTLRHGSRLLPNGRYLTKTLRKMVGKDEKSPKVTTDRLKAELQDLRVSAFENSRSFKKEIVQAADQAVLNMEARQRIFKQRKDKL